MKLKVAALSETLVYFDQTTDLRTPEEIIPYTRSPYSQTSHFKFSIYQITLIGLITSRRWAGSSVGIATVYELDGPGSNPGGGAIFRTRPDRPWGPPSLLYNGYRVFPGGKAAGAWC
jgi:hypothetical protein